MNKTKSKKTKIKKEKKRKKNNEKTKKCLDTKSWVGDSRAEH